ncbi:MAG TPA: hypothetical protein VN081_01125 [Dongiaceae bacterium]|nr:hypothetical protein [Dongiaceae bacterium]
MSNPINRGTVTTPSMGPRPAVNMPPVRPPQTNLGNPSGLTVTVETMMNKFITDTDIKLQLQPAQAIKAQEGLWKTVQLIFNRPANEFAELWGVFLNIVHEHSKDVFAPTYVFRGIQFVPTMGAVGKKNYIRIMQLALKTADPTTRAVVSRQLDFRHIGRQFTDTSWGNKLSDFYRV